MTDLAAEFKALAAYRPTHEVRFVAAAALFDGHDAAVDAMRPLSQSMGAEVIHLGLNRSVANRPCPRNPAVVGHCRPARHRQAGAHPRR